MGSVWVHADSFLHSAASPVHSFVTTSTASRSSGTTATATTTCLKRPHGITHKASGLHPAAARARLQPMHVCVGVNFGLKLKGRIGFFGRPALFVAGCFKFRMHHRDASLHTATMKGRCRVCPLQVWQYSMQPAFPTRRDVFPRAMQSSHAP